MNGTTQGQVAVSCAWRLACEVPVRCAATVIDAVYACDDGEIQQRGTTSRVFAEALLLVEEMENWFHSSVYALTVHALISLCNITAFFFCSMQPLGG